MSCILQELSTNSESWRTTVVRFGSRRKYNFAVKCGKYVVPAIVGKSYTTYYFSHSVVTERSVK